MKVIQSLHRKLLLALSLLAAAGRLLAEDGIVRRSDSPAPTGDGVTVSKNGTVIQEDGNRVEMGDGGATKIDTQNPDFDRGMELLFADRMRDALEYLGRSLQDDPTNPQAYLNRAEAVLKADRCSAEG